jgi:hypothetical protein
VDENGWLLFTSGHNKTPKKAHVPLRKVKEKNWERPYFFENQYNCRL